MTSPRKPARRRPSRVARQRAYAREVAAWEAEVRAERRRLWSYFAAGVATWLIMERAGGHWLMPKVMGLAVWVLVGNACELSRVLKGTS